MAEEEYTEAQLVQIKADAFDALLEHGVQLSPVGGCRAIVEYHPDDDVMDVLTTLSQACHSLTEKEPR